MLPSFFPFLSCLPSSFLLSFLSSLFTLFFLFLILSPNMNWTPMKSEHSRAQASGKHRLVRYGPCSQRLTKAAMKINIYSVSGEQMYWKQHSSSWQSVWICSAGRNWFHPHRDVNRRGLRMTRGQARKQAHGVNRCIQSCRVRNQTQGVGDQLQPSRQGRADCGPHSKKATMFPCAGVQG